MRAGHAPPPPSRPSHAHEPPTAGEGLQGRSRGDQRGGRAHGARGGRGALVSSGGARPTPGGTAGSPASVLGPCSHRPVAGGPSRREGKGVEGRRAARLPRGPAGRGRAPPGRSRAPVARSPRAARQSPSPAPPALQPSRPETPRPQPSPGGRRRRRRRARAALGPRPRRGVPRLDPRPPWRRRSFRRRCPLPASPPPAFCEHLPGEEQMWAPAVTGCICSALFTGIQPRPQ